MFEQLKMPEPMTRDMLIKHVARVLYKQVNYPGFKPDALWLWNYLTSEEMRERYLAIAKDLVDTIQNWFDRKDLS